MCRNIGKSISISLTSKYSQKLLDHAKQSATDVLKTASKRSVQKTGAATRDLIWEKTSDKITRISKTSPQNNSEENIEHDKERHREIDICPEQRQKTFDDLKLM